MRTPATTRSRRDLLVDLAAIAVAVGVGLPISLTSDGPGGPWPVIDLVVGSAACLALWFRRRWPLGVALALLPIGAVSAMGGVAAGIAVFTLAVHRPARVALPVAVLHAAGGAVYLALYPDSQSPYWVSVTMGVLFTAVLVGWGMFVRARRELIASLTERAERAEAEQALRVAGARLGERERIAREMHDVLAHRLSLVSLHAGALEYRPDAPRADVARAAGVIRDNAHRALEELRAVIGALRDDGGSEPEPPQPTLADVPRLVDESIGAGMAVTPDYGLALADAPRDAGRHAYRVVQEGLTNARKHAPRSRVTLRIAGAPGEGLRVEVRNPLPVGAAAAAGIPGAGAGLAGLGERVELAGGRISHGRAGGGDYVLTAWLPWTAPA
ncbi:sensor histidine kinase [Miltoncostaea oceani]|uniref:sensor histidine kinase n=1 Tax=Miltoncostaea oceani TaxID=2843216 RepID=UPI001C3DDF98|nr:histidine kinase [Miltoncostaea oceani]